MAFRDSGAIRFSRPNFARALYTALFLGAAIDTVAKTGAEWNQTECK
jgi:hypothetical protein